MCLLPFGLGPRVFACIAALRVPRRRFLAVPLGLVSLSHAGPAQSISQQPIDRRSDVFVLAAQVTPAPAPQLAPPAPVNPAGTVSGTIVDSDGDSIEGARVTLTPAGEPQPGGSAPDVAVSTSDGRFSFANLPAGSFTLSIVATGFTAQQTSAELHPGESLDLPATILHASSSTNIEVTATQTEIAEAQINQEEKQRVIGVFPNFYVSYVADPVPLDPRQKLELAARTLIDPVSFILNGVVAGAQQADNAYAWGQGAQGFGKRYAAAYGTFLTGTLIGSAALPILLKQDPRYFYKGTGSVASRIGYAFAMAAVCKGDNHHWQPNYSAILGGLAASGLSNLYYPAINRTGAELTFEGAAFGTAETGVFNLIQEFIVRRLTPHVPPRLPPSP
jgi:hypothetical protein